MKRALLVLATACTVTPSGHVGPVTATASAGGRTFSCSRAGIFEHTGDTLRFVAAPELRAFALAACAARDGSPARLLVGGGTPARSGELTLLDVSGHQLANAHVGDDVVYAVALAADRRLAAAACADGGVQVFTLPELAHTATTWRHEGPALALAFAPDGALLASGGRDGKLLLGEPAARARPLALLDHTAAVTCVVWSADGGRLASGAKDGKVRLHDRSGRLLHTWSRLGGAVVSVVVHGDGFACAVDVAPDAPPRTIVLAPR